MRISKRLASAAAASLLLCGLPAKAGSYVFATFKGDTDPGEKLSIYTSKDGENFSLLSDTGFEGTSGTLRDPSIFKHSDGKYYVAYTNPPTASCCGKADHFSIAISSDLSHWSNLAIVNAGVPGVAHTWAPEWFNDGGIVKIIANIDTLNTDSDFKPYVFTALDSSLTSWSGPVPLGIGPNYIDAFVLVSAGTYHAFVKNETTRYCEHATAAALTGPWKFVGTGDWSGWGTGMEGPNIVQLDDGTWRIFLDAQHSGFLSATSSDLDKWSATAPLPNLTNVVRHGTVIRDSSAGAAGTGGTGGAVGTGGVGAAAAGGTALSSSGSAGVNESGGVATGGTSTTGGVPPNDAGGEGGRANAAGGRASLGDGAGTSGASGLGPSESAANRSTDATSGCACRVSSPSKRTGWPLTSFPVALFFIWRRRRTALRRTR